MSKYTHKKTGNALEGKIRRATGEAIVPRALKSRDLRKSLNHETVERSFGSFYPQFGGSAGTAYDASSGVVFKENRAGSKSAPKPTKFTWDVALTLDSSSEVKLAYMYKGDFYEIKHTAGDSKSFEVSATMPHEFAPVGTPSDIAFWIDSPIGSYSSDTYLVYCGDVPFISNDGGTSKINFVTADPNNPLLGDLVQTDQTKRDWMVGIFDKESAPTTVSILNF